MPRQTVRPLVLFVVAMALVFFGWDYLASSFTEPDAFEPRILTPETARSSQARLIVAQNETVPVTVDDAVEALPDTTDIQSSVEFCKNEVFTVTFSPEKVEEFCVDTRSTIQNGGSRAYRFTLAGAGAKILNVSATGTAIDNVELTLPSGKRFICEAENCQGVVIGKRNAEGKRIIGLDSTLKLEAGSGATESATISAKLSTMRDQDVPGLACIGQGVTLIGSDNSSVDFCPLGGHGFSMTEDGSKVFHFSNLENEEIRIEVGEDESLRKISFGGDELACTAESCTGFSIAPRNAKGERVFTFAGTMLSSSLASGETITLNGTLLQPELLDSGTPQ